MATGSSLRADVRQIVKEVRARGFEVREGGSGHLKILDPRTGQFLGSIASTPSDWRAIKNTVADLRSRGVLDQDPKRKERKVEMLATRSERTLSPRQRDLRDRLLETMTTLGFQPGGRTGIQSQLAREVLNQRGPIGTHMSAIDALKRIVKGEKKVSDPAMDQIEAMLDDFDQPKGMLPEPDKPVEPIEAAPVASDSESSRQTEIRKRLIAVMISRGWKEGERSGVQAQINRELAALPGKAMATEGSAGEALRNLLAQRHVSDNVLDKVEMWLNGSKPEFTPTTVVEPEEGKATRSAGRPVASDLHEAFHDVLAFCSEGRDVRDGRKVAYGAIPNLQRLLNTWSSENLPSDRQPSGVAADRAVRSVFDGENLWHRNADAVEGFLRAWRDGWRPGQVVATTASVGDMLDQTKSDQEPTEILDMSQYREDTEPEPIVASTDMLEKQPDSDEAQVPLHLSILAEMLRNADAGPGYRDRQVNHAIKLAMQVMELEQNQR